MTNNSMSLIAHSFVYHPTIGDVDTLQKSNRGIFPSSLYNNLDNDIFTSQTPIIVCISSDTMVKPIYVTAHEFSAMDGQMYISTNLMNDSFISEGDIVNIDIVSLPSITKLVLRPLCKRFAREIIDPKASLEMAII